MERTAKETIRDLAIRARDRRLDLNWTQVGLQQRSGVSLGSIMLFERTGKISLESLVKISIALGYSVDFQSLFEARESTKTPSIDELLNAARGLNESPQKRIRGRLR